MGKFADIMKGRENLADLWDKTEAAGDLTPVPAGKYVCHVTKGELKESSKKETPSYTLEFTAIKGEHVRRKFWLDLWLTAAALPQTKRDLLKLGVDTPAKMDQPLPRWFRVEVKVVLQTDDDATIRNKVKSFEVVGFDAPEADPFAPDEPATTPVAAKAADTLYPGEDIHSQNAIEEGF